MKVRIKTVEEMYATEGVTEKHWGNMRYKSLTNKKGEEFVIYPEGMADDLAGDIVTVKPSGYSKMPFESISTKINWLIPAFAIKEIINEKNTD